MGICEDIKENVNILDYIQKSGFTLVNQGKYYSLKEHDSMIIDSKKNCYWQHSIPGTGGAKGERGSVIDFAIKFNHLSLNEAIRELSRDVPFNGDNLKKREIPKKSEAKKKKTQSQEFYLPKKNSDMNRVYAYLIKTRCIEQKIVQEMVRQGMLYQDENCNCVFVGYDINNKNKPVFACKRGTNTSKVFHGDVEGCDYDQCIYFDNKTDKLIVAECVIDAMSIMTLMGKNWRDYNYLALAGVGKWEAIKIYLKNKNIKEVYIMTDNDKGGILAAQQICCYVRENYLNIKRRWKIPCLKYGKDWNKVLQTVSNIKE